MGASRFFFRETNGLKVLYAVFSSLVDGTLKQQAKNEITRLLFRHTRRAKNATKAKTDHRCPSHCSAHAHGYCHGA